MSSLRERIQAKKKAALEKAGSNEKLVQKHHLRDRTRKQQPNDGQLLKPQLVLSKKDPGSSLLFRENEDQGNNQISEASSLRSRLREKRPAENNNGELKPIVKLNLRNKLKGHHAKSRHGGLRNRLRAKKMSDNAMRNYEQKHPNHEFSAMSPTTTILAEHLKKQTTELTYIKQKPIVQKDIIHKRNELYIPKLPLEKLNKIPLTDKKNDVLHNIDIASKIVRKNITNIEISNIQRKHNQLKNHNINQEEDEEEKREEVEVQKNISKFIDNEQIKIPVKTKIKKESHKDLDAEITIDDEDIYKFKKETKKKQLKKVESEMGVIETKPMIYVEKSSGRWVKVENEDCLKKSEIIASQMISYPITHISGRIFQNELETIILLLNGIIVGILFYSFLLTHSIKMDSINIFFQSYSINSGILESIIIGASTLIAINPFLLIYQTLYDFLNYSKTEKGIIFISLCSSIALLVGTIKCIPLSETMRHYHLIDDLWFQTHDFSEEFETWFLFNDVRFLASALNWICLLKLNQHLKYIFLRNHEYTKTSIM